MTRNLGLFLCAVLATAAMAPTVARADCDKTRCGVVVGACALTCACDWPVCECCAECAGCMGDLWEECCDCFNLCGDSDSSGNSTSKPADTVTAKDTVIDSAALPQTANEGGSAASSDAAATAFTDAADSDCPVGTCKVAWADPYEPGGGDNNFCTVTESSCKLHYYPTGTCDGIGGTCTCVWTKSNALEDRTRASTSDADAHSTVNEPGSALARAPTVTPAPPTNVTGAAAAGTPLPKHLRSGSEPPSAAAGARTAAGDGDGDSCAVGSCTCEVSGGIMDPSVGITACTCAPGFVPNTRFWISQDSAIRECYCFCGWAG